MKAALITGAANGIGACIARMAAARGYTPTLLDVNAAQVRALAAELPGATGHAVDVTDEAAVTAVIDAMPAPPRLVVNNAGIVRFGQLLDIALSDVKQVLDVNLLGTFIVARAAARRMIGNGGGAIINLTSINALTPGPGAGAYPASKGGVATLTSHMALEWGPLGVRVNAIAPGFIDAGMSAPIYAQDNIRKLRGGAVPLKRLGLAEDIAEAVLFLGSDQGGYINGHQLVVDGGVVPSVLTQLPRS